MIIDSILFTLNTLSACAAHLGNNPLSRKKRKIAKIERNSALKVIITLLPLEDSPTGSNSFQLCEHAKQDSKKLSCKNGYEIKITRALYGRKSSSICPHISSKNVRNCGKDELSLKTAQKVIFLNSEAILFFLLIYRYLTPLLHNLLTKFLKKRKKKRKE